MIYGYARASTKGQARDGNSLEGQTAALKEVGADRIFYDSFTGRKTDRPELYKLKMVLSDGDKLIVTKLGEKPITIINAEFAMTCDEQKRH